MLILSFSKINLFLLVSKVKKNGLHKIKSIFLLNRNIYDEINIKKSYSQKITYYKNKKEINIQDCNVKKILKIINIKYNIDTDYEINILKMIPIGSGLGGSASNAAYVAKYILELNEIDYTQDYELFSNVSSDMPFFLSNFECAYVSEYGNKIIEKKIKKIHFELLFNSEETLSRDVYKKFDELRKISIFRNKFLQFILLKLSFYSFLLNDLEESVFCINLNLYKKKSEYKNQKVILKVVGSGSTFIKYSNQRLKNEK